MRNLVCLLLAGCSGGTSPNPMPQNTTLRLLSSPYQLTAGQERFICVRKTVDKDLLITKITPVNGQATHHQVLGIDTTGTVADGTSDCASGSEFNVLKWKMLFASGVNSPPLDIPDGAALKVTAGQQLVFQMHLLNATQQPVDSSASVDVELLPAGTVADEAQMILAGPIPDHRVTPDIPVGDNQMVEGQCTLVADTHFFAVFPHMHQVGKHITVRTSIGADKNVIYDSDYDFNNQVFAQFPSISLHKGDEIDVTCIYDNQTGAPVEFGQSSYNEMCYAISYFYPALPTGTFGDFCTN